MLRLSRNGESLNIWENHQNDELEKRSSQPRRLVLVSGKY